MADSNAASGAMWALVTVILVLLIVAVLYFSGLFNRKKEIDINVETPKSGTILLMGETRFSFLRR
ncbi:MAG: hypothetical protein AB1757_09615 [Acidobacteriota bacterium]